jgi:hypothetical protein
MKESNALLIRPGSPIETERIKALAALSWSYSAVILSKPGRTG